MEFIIILLMLGHNELQSDKEVLTEPNTQIQQQQITRKNT